jgi:hypothetical protein
MRKLITFVDSGQDFLEWTIDEQGVVVDCRPYQAAIWLGTIVLNQKIEAGCVLEIECRDGRITNLIHRVESVEEMM